MRPLYLLRWVVTLVILIVLQDNPSFQILTLLIISLMQQCLLVLQTPFQSKSVNIISIFNETAVSLYLYVAFLLTDYLEAQLSGDIDQFITLRVSLSWLLTCILMLTIFINFLFFIVRFAVSTFKHLKRNKLLKCLGKKQSDIKYLEAPFETKPSEKAIPYQEQTYQKQMEDAKQIQELDGENKFHPPQFMKILQLKIRKAKIQDMKEQKEFEKTEELKIFENINPQIYNEEPLADINEVDEEFEDIPDAYVFAKGEQLNDQPEEKKNSQFDFYDNI